MCAYGLSCNRKGCVYRHPPKPAGTAIVKRSGLICVHFVAGNCTFGDKCANRHPGKAEAEEFRDACSRIACKFGDACENASCLYAHGEAATFAGRMRKLRSDEWSPAVFENRWWVEYFADSEACDPISLEPLKDLSHEPFELGGHWFDGCVLASYLVASASFVNPMTRESLSRDDCLRLDDYVEKLMPPSKRPRCTQAFDLFQLQQDSGPMRREATSLLHSLFGYEEQRSQPTTLADAFKDKDEEEDVEPEFIEEGARLDNAFFPSLGAAPQVHSWVGPSFAEKLAQPAIGRDLQGRQNLRQAIRKTIRVPQDLWIAYRDASVFEVRDPFARFQRVQANHSRPDVLDLHFQSARTAKLILDYHLVDSLQKNSTGVWVITGSGHHAPTNSHQKLRGHLHAIVKDYLNERQFQFLVAKDNCGHAGAFFICADDCQSSSIPTDSASIRHPSMPCRSMYPSHDDSAQRHTALSLGPRSLTIIGQSSDVGIEPSSSDRHHPL